MKKYLLPILLLFLVSVQFTPISAQKSNSITTDRSQVTLLVNFDCEGTNCAGLSVDNTVGGVVLTASKYNPTVTDQSSGFSRAQIAYCTNSGAKIWVTTTPSITLSSGKGQPVNDGGQFTIYGYTNITNFKAIRDAAVSSQLYCDYSRQP